MDLERKRKAVDEIDLMTISSDDEASFDCVCVGVTQKPGGKARAPVRRDCAAPAKEVAAIECYSQFIIEDSKTCNDFAIAQSLAAQENCSQFTPQQNQERRGTKRTFECGICFEEKVPGYSGFSLACRHRYCKPCLSGLIEASL